MEKQPNSRMCFVCGIDNPIGLHLSFYTDDEGRCIAHFRPQAAAPGLPRPTARGIDINLTGRTNSNCCTLFRFRCMTPYDLSIEG